MAAQETTPAGYWSWEPAGKPIRILVNLELVDRMLTTVIDGFGSLPKRGAEVGGVLLGARQRDNGKLLVTIEDYLPVNCSHRFGPSYVLSDEDLEYFEATVRQNDGVIGYYRSQTRDGLSLGAEDLQYVQRFFAGPDDVVLLVKPAAMKVSKAGFFYYQNGELQDQTDLEFPFRRSELETGEAPTRRPLGERRPPPSFEPPVARPPRPGDRSGGGGGGGSQSDQRLFEDPIGSRDPFGGGGGGGSNSGGGGGLTPVAPRSGGGGGGMQTTAPVPLAQPVQNYPAPQLNAAKLRKNWVWFPLSFIFLLLGVLLGFQAAMTFNTGKPGSQDPYELSLFIERRNQDLTVRWDRANPGIRTASKAVLEIQDGKYSKRVDLDSAALQTGSVIYRFSTDNVRFTLNVYPKDRVVLSESVDWKGGAADK